MRISDWSSTCALPILDPLATGVLPIAVGEATKLCGRMLDASKIYDFTIAFGEQTDTLDAEGAVIARSDHQPSLSEVEAVLERFKIGRASCRERVCHAV